MRIPARLRTLCLALAFIVAACDSPVGPSAPVSVTLRVGEPAVVTDDTRLQLLGIVSESRCPLNALCVQAGDVVVEIEVTVEGASGTYRLALNDVGRRAVSHRRVRVTLEAVQPYPIGGVATDPADYRVALRVEAED